jgi:hypothetical protein
MKADEVLYELRSWLEEEASSDFYDWYISEDGGHDPNLTNRNFWDNHLW